MKPGNLSVKTVLNAGTPLLMITSMASAYAEEGDINQTHSHEFTRTELNSQLANSSFGQSRN